MTDGDFDCCPQLWKLLSKPNYQVICERGEPIRDIRLPADSVLSSLSREAGK